MSNTITITGNLGKDPELKYVGANGLPVCELSIGATPRKLNKTTNEWENRGAPQWYRVTAFENEAEAWTEAFSKGDKITATGTLVVEEYTTKDGRDGYTLTIVNATVGKVPHAQKQPQNAPYGANRGTPAPQHGQASFSAPQGGTVGDPWSAPQGDRPPF
ncbi:single-stranded DNA-binding protein [Trueperella pecoris]|uniref:Single-stranded DNA-binding protein n=1 Tax=Trueperella pecoris TaxID=2733571 RepID=A0A7M1R012_9ACTO|nr:single-stranded DNA-binding protein [Trueperella pecoris]QOR47600.1 single-stranded DNA-binding protein [Trueperella pecoris]